MNEKVRVLTCKRCGHRWIPLVPHPVMCPSCHSKYWDKDYVRSDKVLPNLRLEDILS